MHKGEAGSGVLIVRINTLDGFSLLTTEGRDFDGNLEWYAPLGEEPLPDEQVDAYLARASDRDPDTWIIEIEDKSGANPFAI